MKKISILIIFMAIFGTAFSEKIDVSVKPEPMPEKEFLFPEYFETELKNELKLFIIEDHEQPVVSFSLMIPGGESQDGDLPGITSMMASLMTKGAGKYSAYDIANKIDGIGASLSVSSSADYVKVSASGLKKHIDLILEMLYQVITNPKFPEEEIEKMKKQAIAGIEYSKSQSTELASKMARIAVYGNNHPYAAFETEKSINKITRKKLMEHYKRFFNPNNASLAIIGDVDPSGIRIKIDEIFGKWEKGDKPGIRVPRPQPLPIGIYFVERPGAVQSTVMFAAPAPIYSDDDYMQLDLAAAVMGGGFGSRLVRTLRETHSYTYSPYGYVTSTKSANRFVCGADVRNSVTDSAIIVMKNELMRLTMQPADDEEINRIKKYERGKYNMSLENSSFISGLIQNAWLMEIPIKKVKEYADELMNISAHQVMDISKQYIVPTKAYFVVVGDPSVKKQLEKLGQVYSYNLDMESISGENAALEKTSLTPAELLENYVDAVADEDDIKELKSLIAEGKASMITGSGMNMDGTFKDIKKSGNKYYSLMDFGMIKQETWTNDTESWIEAMGSFKKQEGDELKRAVWEKAYFPIADMIKAGFECTVLGRKGDVTIMKAVSPWKEENIIHFNDDYLVKKIETKTTQQGITVNTIREFSGFKDFGDFTLPTIIKVINPRFTITMNLSYKLNQEIDDNTFVPEQK